MNLSIIIPVFNEEKNLLNLYHEIRIVFGSFIKWEVIIVDDNSSDKSYSILKLINKKKNFNVIFLKNKNRDLSQSVLIGAKKSKSNLVAVMDGDMQHRPKDLLRMYIYITKHQNLDILVGCRNLHFSKNQELSNIRLFFSKVLILIVKIMLGHKTADPMSGIFIFKKSLIKYSNNFYAKGFKILLDFIYSSNKQINIKDFKINFASRINEKSKMNLKVCYYLIISILKKSFKIFK